MEVAKVLKYEMTDEEITERLGLTLADIAILDKRYREIKVTGIDDQDNYKLAKSSRMELVHYRTGICKAGLSMREEAKIFSNKVISIEKKIIAAVTPIEEYLVSQEKIVDDEKARIKAEADAKEAARMQARIDKICSFGATFNGQTYSALGLQIASDLVKVCTDELYLKFIDQLQAAKDAADAKEKADEDARMAETARLAKIAEEQKVEARRLADIQAAQDKQAADIKAEQDAIDAEKKRIADEQTRVENEKRRKEELEKAKTEAVEKARIEIEAKIRRQVEEKEKFEARAKAGAEKKAGRAPDKVKLLALADTLAITSFPAMKSKEGDMYLRNFKGKFAEAIKYLKDEAEAM